MHTPTPPTFVRPGEHLLHLDSVRGLCALYVTACHAWLMYASEIARLGLHTPSGGLLLATSWLAFGRSAVAVFIVLSGYCLMLPVVQSPDRALPSGTWHFMIRRARRILPPYYGALAVSLALILLVPGLADPGIGEWHKSFPALEPGSLLSHVLLLHNYFPAHQYAINHPLWSIATEWQIYLLFPLFVVVNRRYGEFRLILLAAATSAALSVCVVVIWDSHNPWPPQFVALFGFGMACAAWNHPRDGKAAPMDPVRWRRGAVLLLVVGVASNLVFGRTREQIPDLLVGGGAGCALVFLTDRASRGGHSLVLRLLTLQPLVTLGRFSFSLYLVHAPILALAYLLAKRWELGAMAMQFFILGVAVPATVGLSYLFFLMFERPALRLARRQPKLDATHPATAARAEGGG